MIWLPLFSITTFVAHFPFVYPPSWILNLDYRISATETVHVDNRKLHGIPPVSNARVFLCVWDFLEVCHDWSL